MLLALTLPSIMQVYWRIRKAPTPAATVNKLLGLPSLPKSVQLVTTDFSRSTRTFLICLIVGWGCLALSIVGSSVGNAIQVVSPDDQPEPVVGVPYPFIANMSGPEIAITYNACMYSEPDPYMEKIMISAMTFGRVEPLADPDNCAGGCRYK